MAEENNTPACQNEIRSRNDLSFTDFGSRTADKNWTVPHDENTNFDNCARLGGYFFSEIAALAASNESEAFDAIRFALLSHGWQPSFGIEVGFAAELAAAAMVGLRTIREGADLYDYASKKKRLMYGEAVPLKNNKLKGR